MRALFVSACVAALAAHGYAQQQPPTASQPTPNGAGLDLSWSHYVSVNHSASVNAANGNLITALPLASVGQQGTTPRLNLWLVHNSIAVDENLPTVCDLGPGWSVAGTAVLVYSPTGGAEVTFGDGTQVAFLAGAAGAPWQGSAGYFMELDPTTHTITDRVDNRWIFDASGRLVTHRDVVGNEMSFTYQGPGGQLSRVVDGSGRSVDFVYTAGLLSQVVNPVPSVPTWDVTHDAQGRLDGLSCVMDGNPQLFELTYSPQDRVRTLEDPRGHEWTYSYQAGRLDTVKDPDGTVVADFGHTTQSGDTVVTLDLERPATITLTFDPSGRMTHYQQPTSEVWEYTYDNNHQVTSLRDPLQRVWSFGVDGAGNVLWSEDPLLERSDFTFDTDNVLLTATDPAGHAITFHYDDPAYPRLATRVEYPAPEPGEPRPVVQYEYLAPGHPSGKGLLERMTDPAGVVTEFSYDAWGQVTTIVEGAGHPNAVTNTFVVGEDSVTSRIDYTPGAGVVPPSFPPVPGPHPALTGRLDYLTTAGPSAWGGLTAYESLAIDVPVDPVGPLPPEPSALVETLRSYDHLGRLDALQRTNDQATVAAGGSAVMRSFSVSHDDALGTTTTLGPDGDALVVAIDANGREASWLRTTALWGQASGTREYYADGRLQHDTRFDDAGAPHSRVTWEYRIDGMPFAKELQLYDGSGWVCFYRLEFTWSARDLLTRVIESTDAVTVAVTEYDYDGPGRLVEERRVGLAPLHVEYEYDAVGNRTRRSDLLAGTETQYHYDHEDPALYGSRQNRLMYSEAFDGGVLSETRWYHYEKTFGHVEEIVAQTAGDPLYRAARFVYAGNNTLWLIQEHQWELDLSQQIVNHQWLRCLELRQPGIKERELVALRDPVTLQKLGGPGDAIWSDVFPGDGPAPHFGDFEVSDPVSGSVQQRELLLPGELRQDAGGTYRYFSDLVGTTRFLIDGNQQPAWSALYDAFGVPVAEQAPGTEATHRFAGLHGGRSFAGASTVGIEVLNLGQRYYAPDIGRWIMRDPMGVGAGPNVYAYCTNQPTVRVDPLGHNDAMAPPGPQPNEHCAGWPIGKTSPYETHACPHCEAIIDGHFHVIGVSRIPPWQQADLPSIGPANPGGQGGGGIPGLQPHHLPDLALAKWIELYDLLGPDDRATLSQQLRTSLELGRRRRVPTRKCFEAGTPVALPGGAVAAIESLGPGDVVLAYDFTKGEVVPAEVERLETWDQELDMARLGVGDGAPLNVDPQHAFWAGDRWVHLAEVLGHLEGHAFRDLAGGERELVLLDRERRRARVHNLRIRGLDSYFVGEAGLLVRDH